MDIMQSVKTVLNNYANFDGRSGRAEFWWWVLAYVVASVVVQLPRRRVGHGQHLKLGAMAWA